MATPVVSRGGLVIYSAGAERGRDDGDASAFYKRYIQKDIELLLKAQYRRQIETPEFELAKTKTADALRAFEAYLRGSWLDIDQYRQLAEALGSAIDEFLDALPASATQTSG